MKALVDLDTQLATMEADEKLGLHDLSPITGQQRVFVCVRPERHGGVPGSGVR